MILVAKSGVHEGLGAPHGCSRCWVKTEKSFCSPPSSWGCTRCLAERESCSELC